jgi:protein-L-isoaspartate O-methyltransferase
MVIMTGERAATAIAASLVGPNRRVTGIEIDPGLAERAREMPTRWPQVSVVNADGSSASLDPADVIIAARRTRYRVGSMLSTRVADYSCQ